MPAAAISCTNFHDFTWSFHVFVAKTLIIFYISQENSAPPMMTLEGDEPSNIHFRKNEDVDDDEQQVQSKFTDIRVAKFIF